jgi:capsule polysaccharide export protein KpsE/RkpR
MVNPRHRRIEFFRLLYQNRKLLIITFLAAAVLSVVFSLVMPQWFRSYTTILPPVSDEGSFQISALLESIPLAGMALGNISEDTDLFLAILKSRNLMEAAAMRFGLQRRYNKKNLEETVKELRDHVAAEVDDEGMITFMAEARAPWLAAKAKRDEARSLSRDMALFFIKKLDELNRQLKTEKAGNIRRFIEKRYHENLNALHQAEEAMKAFQQKHGIIALTEQTRATVTAAAELQARIMAKEIEANVLANYVGKTHVDYIKVRNEIQEMRKRYRQLQGGSGSEPGAGARKSDTVFLPFEEAPELGVRYLRFYRELTLQETLLEFLLPQYEEAKINEARDTPTVQVLDEASLPVKKHRPKRALFCIFWTFLAVLLMVLFLFFRPAFRDVWVEMKQKTS